MNIYIASKWQNESVDDSYSQRIGTDTQDGFDFDSTLLVQQLRHLPTWHN
jgi:hypothetical protein